MQEYKYVKQFRITLGLSNSVVCLFNLEMMPKITAMRKLMYLLPFIVLSIISCSKQDISKPASSGQLKETRTYYGDSIYYRYFYYNIQGNLTLIKDSINFPNWKPILRFLNYDLNGRLEKITTIDYFTTSDRIFYYNNTGQIVRAKDSMTSQPNTWTGYSKFVYDSKGRIIADSSIDGLIIRNVYNYVYDQNDNIVTVNIAGWNYASNMLQAYPGTTNITYGAKANPYDSVGTLLYILLKDWRYLNKNNILADNTAQSFNTYSYLFSTSGQALEMTQTFPGFTSPYNQLITRFFY